MVTMRRGLARAGLLAAAAALALAGCSSSGSAANGGTSSASVQASGKPEVSNITFGILPTPDYAGVQIAIDKGYFKAEGLNVKTTILNSATASADILNNTYQIAGLNWINFIAAVDQGVGLTAVTTADYGVPNYAQIMVSAKSPYHSLADLNGKPVGVVATPGNCDLIPDAQIAATGSSAKPKYENLAIPQMQTEVSNGGVAAACVPQPTLGAMQATGQFRSVDDVFSGKFAGFPIATFVTSKSFAQQNPSTVAALARALSKAAQQASANPGLVRTALKEYTTIPAAAIEKMVLPTYADGIDQSKLQTVVNLIKSSGLDSSATLPTGSVWEH
ncbi:MAG TPA: ABC transporter substrate-binding protein [Trebonia sp.]|jgi:NitT/TauT family transport system substrate-binding protein|nr:ABC transporter substrate-binding protein [Trebonia sp.]